MRTPNEVVAAGIEMQLGGKEPATREEQGQLMNFVAANVAEGLSASVCKLMKAIYPEYFGELSEQDVLAIAGFQEEHR